jgi:2-methylisocitrate lyase-like PEP mutase family enzyme
LPTPAQCLREILSEPNVEIMPRCYDALSAKLIADAGYKVAFMSGFAVSAARLGLPDTGLISFTEMLDSLRNCCAATGPVPLIGDATPVTAMHSTFSGRLRNTPGLAPLAS